MSDEPDIHTDLAEFGDIPGTRVYTAARARKGLGAAPGARRHRRSNTAIGHIVLEPVE